LGPQIPKFAALFVLPLITPHLESVDYGVYGIITSYTGILTGLSDLGFSVVLVNSYYKHPTKWRFIWRQLHFYLIVWSIIYSVITAFLIYFIIPGEAVKNLLWIILSVCLPSLFFNSTITIASRYYQFAQKPFYMAIVSAIVGTVAIALNLFTISTLKLGYMGWFVSTALATGIQFIFFCYPVFVKYRLSPILSFRKRFLRKQLKVSLPTIPHNYSSYLLNSSDRIVMDNMGVKVSEIGKFNLAYTFGNYFDFLVTAVGMAIGPFYTSVIAKGTRKSENDYHFITHWLQFSFILVGFLLSLWAKELMQVLIRNDELKMVYPLSIIIIMGYVSRPYYWAIVTRMQFNEQTQKLWRISFIAGVLNVILNIILVPKFGIMAAAITTFVALLYMGFSGYYLKITSTEMKKSYYPATFIVIITLSTLVVYLLKDISPVFKLGISLFLLLLFLLYSWKYRTVIKHIEV
jgi:O-antigen/teichoic acid export membrane protein